MEYTRLKRLIKSRVTNIVGSQPGLGVYHSSECTRTRIFHMFETTRVESLTETRVFQCWDSTTVGSLQDLGMHESLESTRVQSLQDLDCTSSWSPQQSVINHSPGPESTRDGVHESTEPTRFLSLPELWVCQILESSAVGRQHEL